MDIFILHVKRACMIEITLAALILLGSLSSVFAYAGGDDENTYFVRSSICGPVGIADKSVSLEPAGVPYKSPGRTRVISHVYLGYALDFYLPGQAVVWVWIGPMLI